MESTLNDTTPNPMRGVLGIRDFMLLWIGQTTSLLGDQFHGIAAAWLVLKMTGDPLALGAVMAVGGIPRAFFTLVGGAITDRFSPRRVMLVSDIIRLFLSGFLAVQIFTGTLQVWMIYAYALVGGIVGGFFGPASMSIVPHIVPEKYLGAGNSLTQGTAQLIGFLGPALAGVLIAAFPDEKIGTAVLITLDAFTFIISIVTLWMMRTGGEMIASSSQVGLKTVFGSVKDGIIYMVKDPALRLMFIVIAIANMSFGGPIIVGIPYLADTRFPEGAAAYGIIISGYAGGNLLGILLAGGLPRPTRKALRILLVALFVIFAVGIAAIGWISSTWLATLDLFVMGLLNGYISILLITALQKNTPREMLGRLMSLVLFANMALIPISQAIAGGVLRWNVPLLFVGASVLLGVLALYLTTPKASNEMVKQIFTE